MWHQLKLTTTTRNNFGLIHLQRGNLQTRVLENYQTDAYAHAYSLPHYSHTCIHIKMQGETKNLEICKNTTEK